MGFSSLAAMNRRIPPQGRQQARRGRVTGVILHYNYGINAFGEASRPGREVSANYWITNEGVIIPNIDEQYRAFTSGASGYPNGALADHYSISIEISNSPGFLSSNPRGAVSDAAWYATCRLIGDVFKRYNLGPVRRTTSPTAVGVRCHNDFVDTSCPGEYLKFWMPNMLARAEEYRVGKPTPTASSPIPDASTLVVDGYFGPASVTKLQTVLGTTADGVISGQAKSSAPFHERLRAVRYDGGGSQAIVALQKGLGVSADGLLGPATIKAWQRRLGVSADGYFGPATATAAQKSLNNGKAH